MIVSTNTYLLTNTQDDSNLKINSLKDVTADNVKHTLTFIHADGSPDKVLDMSSMANDIHIASSTFDKVTGTLKLTDSDGKDISIDLSDFVSSAELTTAIQSKLTYDKSSKKISYNDGQQDIDIDELYTNKVQTVNNTNDKEFVSKKNLYWKTYHQGKREIKVILGFKGFKG